MVKTIGRFLHSGSTVSVAANASVLFDSVTADQNVFGYDGNGGIQLRKPGTYIIHSSFVDVATSANQVSFQMFAGGTAVPGSVGSVVPAAIGDITSVDVIGVKTVVPSGEGYATISFRPSRATSVSDALVIVEKVS